MIRLDERSGATRERMECCACSSQRFLNDVNRQKGKFMREIYYVLSGATVKPLPERNKKIYKSQLEESQGFRKKNRRSPDTLANSSTLPESLARRNRNDECGSFFTYERVHLNYSPNWILMFSEKAENKKNLLCSLAYLVGSCDGRKLLNFWILIKIAADIRNLSSN